MEESWKQCYEGKAAKTHTVRISRIYLFMDRSRLWVETQEVNYKNMQDNTTTSEQQQG